MLLSAVISTVTACSADGGITISETDTDPPILVHDVRGGAEEAEINGYLRHLAGPGCLVLESEPDAEQLARNVVVWPPGSEPVEESGVLVGVDVPGFGLVRVGDWVSGGGGYHHPDTSEVDLPEAPAECLVGGGEFAALHEIGTAGPAT